jgi:flagellar motor switch protein FliM
LYNILAFDPLPGRAVLIFSPEVAWVILERLLGGSGRTQTPASKPLTDIGQTLIRSTIEFMMNDVKAAWSKIVQLEPRLEDATINNLWVTMLMRNARIVLITFELLIQGVTGTMSLYIPLSMLKPVANALTPSAWIAEDQARPNEQVRTGLSQVVVNIDLPLTVELGTARLNLENLASLAVGDVLRLDKMVGQELDLKIADRPRFHVAPGLVGNRLAVRVNNRISDNMEAE